MVTFLILTFALLILFALFFYIAYKYERYHKRRLTYHPTRHNNIMTFIAVVFLCIYFGFIYLITI